MTAEKHSYLLRIDPGLFRALNALAGVRSLPVSQVIADLLAEGWERAPEQEALAKILEANAKKQGTPKNTAKKASP